MVSMCSKEMIFTVCTTDHIRNRRLADIITGFWQTSSLIFTLTQIVLNIAFNLNIMAAEEDVILVHSAQWRKHITHG